MPQVHRRSLPEAVADAAQDDAARDDADESSTETGCRTWGKSKDHREDLPQVVVGIAVTRTGIAHRVAPRAIGQRDGTGLCMAALEGPGVPLTAEWALVSSRPAG